MPIKDITNEEKSNLYMVGKKPPDLTRITENERGLVVLKNSIFHYDVILATYNTVLPLAYFDILADQVGKKDDGLSEYTSAANHFFNNDVQNPNTLNKHNAYPLTMVTKLTQKEQDFISEFLTNTVEKLHWEPAEIAMQLKVITRPNIL